MAQDIGQSTVVGAVTKTIKERTHHTVISTIDNASYTVRVNRETKTTVSYPDGTSSTNYERGGAPAVVGEPAAGTDGTEPSHYPDAKAGWLPSHEAQLAELVALPGYFEAGPGQRSRVYWEDIDDVVVFMLETIVARGKAKQLKEALAIATAKKKKQLEAVPAQPTQD